MPSFETTLGRAILVLVLGWVLAVAVAILGVAKRLLARKHQKDYSKFNMFI